MRLFIGIALPNDVRNALSSLQKKFKASELIEARYTDPANMHVTLAFYPQLDKKKLKKLISILSEVKHKPIPATLDNIELTQSNHPILWVRIISPKLNDLAQIIQKSLSEFKEPETRPFSAHITLARVKKIYDLNSLQQFIDHISAPKISWVINRFDLIQSVLTPDGPEYTTLKSFKLSL